jgi:predicted ATP-dependent serine protease
VIIRRLLAKEAGQRYSSMCEVRSDLASLTQGGTGNTVTVPGETAVTLIGRGTERDQVMRLLQGAVAGRGSLVLIGGEPGIGKTQLTRRF